MGTAVERGAVIALSPPQRGEGNNCALRATVFRSYFFERLGKLLGPENRLAHWFFTWWPANSAADLACVA